MWVKEVGASPANPAAGAAAPFIPSDVIVGQIAPLIPLSVERIRELVERFDEDKIGGLTETQWVLFCEENQKYFASLGEDRMCFGRFLGYCVPDATQQPSRTRRFGQAVVRFLEGFAAGGVAGAVSKTVIAPGDRVKIIFQVDSGRRFTLGNAVRLGVKTVRDHGFLGLWIGNGAMMMRVVPYSAITFVSFDYYHSGLVYLSKYHHVDGATDESLAVALRFLGGSFAGATATTCTYPLDLMRARLAFHSCSEEKLPSYRVACNTLVKTHGWKALYAGLVPTLVGIMPYAGCSFAVFETLKSRIVKWRNLPSDKAISVHERMVAGGLAGLIAQSATYPLDIVRRRMQVAPRRYRGVFHALRLIYKEEGLLQGWYKGLQMNWIKGPIAVATGFTVNDIVKRRMREYDEKYAQYSHREYLVTIPEALACGGVAAGVAKLWTVPFDRLKIMYQVGLGASDTHKFGSQGFAFKGNMYAENPNIWQGSGITMMRVIPYGALAYCFFDIFQTASERLLFSLTPTPATNFLAGGAAAALTTTILYPLDLVRTKAATNRLPSFSQSYYWTLRDMARQKGLRSLWEGGSLAVMGVVPCAGIGFATYEFIKERYECANFGQRLLAGMCAGVAGQFTTYPLNIARRQRQVEQLAYSGLGDLKKVFMNPGFYASLYRKPHFGLSIGPMALGMSFALNDFCRDGVVKARKEILHDLFFTGSAA
ncbi:putative mitochondrial carrier protein [Trypanosoma conorhini]|uniref:Putative mitochondrial carrier protein n=1 Tax=Trypanosoma conorhini TaxID=83891 RepID=A0A3R7LM83_9TRYP|nr:putative mitochondrial carrier protein [Trypanosoma conorhini]RNF17191.1 putative mitochondrial carrier protein [Trypanosoma conorhini]